MLMYFHWELSNKQYKKLDYKYCLSKYRSQYNNFNLLVCYNLSSSVGTKE